MKLLLGLVMLVGMVAYSTPALISDLAPQTAHASAPVPLEAPIVVEPAPTSTTTIEALVRATAAQYGLGDDFYKTLECESAGWQDIQSQVPHAAGPNGREDSWGVAQIHLPDHLEVTKDEALDPSFAVPWAAEQFTDGHASIFTCYNEL